MMFERDDLYFGPNPSSQCASHGKAETHIVRRDGNGAVWRCSGCGREGYWTKSWSYWGNDECKRCWGTVVDFVVCSDKCKKPARKRFKEGTLHNPISSDNVGP